MGQGTSADLVTKIRSALEQEVRLNIEKYPLELMTEDNKVVLDGRTGDIVAKRLAANIATRIAGDTATVIDHVRVTTPEPMEDLALRDNVVKTLSSESAFRDYSMAVEIGSHQETVHYAPDNGRILISVSNGVITLNGQVGSLSHRRLAEVLVWWSRGCERVDNFLALVPPEEDNDNELADAVRMVLEKDPTVHGDELTIGCAGAVVELYGSVHNEEARLRILRDTWYVPGVWDVNDRIAVQA
jgi:osmotically-inducible protein OsmY